MFKMTKSIYQKLIESDKILKVSIHEGEGFSLVELPFPIDTGGNYRIHFISLNDDNDVSVRVHKLIQVKQDQVDKMLPVINKLNNEYRYVKFSIDENLRVNVAYDYPKRMINPERSAEEIVAHFVRIIDEAYPVLMRGLLN